MAVVVGGELAVRDGGGRRVRRRGRWRAEGKGEAKVAGGVTERGILSLCNNTQAELRSNRRFALASGHSTKFPPMALELANFCPVSATNNNCPSDPWGEPRARPVSAAPSRVAAREGRSWQWRRKRDGTGGNATNHSTATLRGPVGGLHYLVYSSFSRPSHGANRECVPSPSMLARSPVELCSFPRPPVLPIHSIRPSIFAASLCTS